MHILILCTGNSARSQMAEAMLNLKGTGRVVAESAGSQPAERVNPFAVKALAEVGDPTRGIHSIQIEMNRGLYLDELLIEKAAGFSVLGHRIAELGRALARAACIGQ